MIVKAVCQVLDTWPDKLERDRGWRPDQINEAQAVIDEMREMLADAVTGAVVPPVFSTTANGGSMPGEDAIENFLITLKNDIGLYL